ncbi:MAG: hypothetical protein WKF44_10135 [Rubrobacteraceae bacterium]|nr:hypothetical protein [Rubrobacter sp.]
MKATRSLLAVPATNAKMVEKALASEDAVAPDSKAGAREMVYAASIKLARNTLDLA